MAVVWVAVTLAVMMEAEETMAGGAVAVPPDPRARAVERAAVVRVVEQEAAARVAAKAQEMWA